MKAIICLLAGALCLTGFRNDEENINGIWLGYYKSDEVKEKIVVKFCSQDRLEFYAGGVDESSKCDGSYRLLGDSISFRYTRDDGQVYEMKGQFSRRKNFVDGVWKSSNNKGSFFMERQDIEEKVVAP